MATTTEALNALRRYDNDAHVAGYISARHPDLIVEAVQRLEERARAEAVQGPKVGE